MTLRFAFQLAFQLLLGWYLNNLVIDDAISKRNIGQESEEVSGDTIAIHGNGQIGLDNSRHVDDIHIHE